MKIERRMFGDISSHPRDCNKTDQTKELCPWTMLPLAVSCHMGGFSLHTAPSRASERSQWELWFHQAGGRPGKDQRPGSAVFAATELSLS